MSTQAEFDKKADRIVLIVCGLLGIGGVIWLGWYICSNQPSDPVAPPSDMKLLSGDPRRDWVVAFHDQKRAMTCYVNSQHGGIWCVEDIIVEDQARLLVLRDAGQ